MNDAPPADATPASTRGNTPNTWDPWTRVCRGSGWVNGAVTTTPTANAPASARASATRSPTRDPHSRYTVPRARNGTSRMAPNR